MTLKDISEELSDYMQSTFTAIGTDNELFNCLGLFEDDFEKTEKFILDKIPNAKVKFELLDNNFKDAPKKYGMYRISLEG